MDKLVGKMVARGLLSDFDVRAGPMKQWLDASEHSSKVALLPPGATCLTGKDKVGSDIDYAVADKLTACWMWDMGVHKTSLATHTPV